MSESGGSDVLSYFSGRRDFGRYFRNMIIAARELEYGNLYGLDVLEGPSVVDVYTDIVRASILTEEAAESSAFATMKYLFAYALVVSAKRKGLYWFTRVEGQAFDEKCKEFSVFMDGIAGMLLSKASGCDMEMAKWQYVEEFLNYPYTRDEVREMFFDEDRESWMSFVSLTRSLAHLAEASSSAPDTDRKAYANRAYRRILMMVSRPVSYTDLQDIMCEALDIIMQGVDSAIKERVTVTADDKRGS